MDTNQHRRQLSVIEDAGGSRQLSQGTPPQKQEQGSATSRHDSDATMTPLAHFPTYNEEMMNSNNPIKAPSIRPGDGQGSSVENQIPEEDYRRPSVASTTTVGSSNSASGSRSSVGKSFRKKLTGLFGDDTPANDPSENEPRKPSEAPESSQSSLSAIQSTDSQQPVPRNPSRSESPSNSRPRTPNPPSSDVTPWIFQDHKVNPADQESFASCVGFSRCSSEGFKLSGY